MERLITSIPAIKKPNKIGTKLVDDIIFSLLIAAGFAAGIAAAGGLAAAGLVRQHLITSI